METVFRFHMEARATNPTSVNGLSQTICKSGRQHMQCSFRRYFDKCPSTRTAPSLENTLRLVIGRTNLWPRENICYRTWQFSHSCEERRAIQLEEGIAKAGWSVYPHTLLSFSFVDREVANSTPFWQNGHCRTFSKTLIVVPFAWNALREFWRNSSILFYHRLFA